MCALPSSFVSIKNTQPKFFSDSSLRAVDQCLLNINPGNLSAKTKFSKCRRSLTIQASGERQGNTGIFIGGFILGGLVIGTLGCVYAPQISKALAGADRKDLMRKLPKFIYDEDKALEKTRRVLTEKIAQLNSAIDDVSSQLRADDASNGAAINPDEIEASA